ncbi:Uncharacterised protein [Vibrio cholerae]|nr:Uncharacterised protein [Vibrio cholerae]CSD49953.1 Uncharacterised protein [Vibrio cholerae]
MSQNYAELTRKCKMQHARCRAKLQNYRITIGIAP